MADNEETQTEERELNQFGEAFIAGRSRRNAQRALDAADAVEVSQTRVRAVRDGYFAPPEVVDKYAELLEEETAREAEEQEAAQAELAAQEAAAAEAARDPETAQDTDTAASETTPAEEEPELPNSKWTVPQIDEWAGKQDPPIVFDEGAVKADKLRAIDAAVNQKKE